MTIRELIDVLKMMPQDMMVVIPGYEGGFDNPKLSSDWLILDDGQTIGCVVVGRE